MYLVRLIYLITFVPFFVFYLLPKQVGSGVGLVGVCLAHVNAAKASSLLLFHLFPPLLIVPLLFTQTHLTLLCLPAHFKLLCSVFLFKDLVRHNHIFDVLQ